MSLPGSGLTDGGRTLIISQGPLAPEGYDDDAHRPDHAGYGRENIPDTGAHFWRMCHAEGAGAVAMLCRAQKGFTGCAEYYPDEGRTKMEWDEGKVGRNYFH